MKSFTQQEYKRYNTSPLIIGSKTRTARRIALSGDTCLGEVLLSIDLLLNNVKLLDKSLAI